MVLTIILLAALLPLATLAANNWTQPCHTGQCQWDLPAKHGSGTMRLSGSNSSISDLTPAGGWTILNCNATSADQEIRLVCHDPSKCDHLYLNGAENTVVRLPDDCSSEPFAVVTRVWNHTDQSVPASTQSLLERHGGSQRLVQGINLSTDFAGTNSSQHGNVTVFVLGSSMPGINDLAEAIPGCGTKDTVSSPQGCNLTSVTLSLFNPGKGSKSGSFTLPGQTFQTNLFNDSFSCPQSGSVPAFNGNVSVDLTSTVAGSVNYAVTFSGVTSALKSPSTALSLVVGFDASLDGTLSLNADLMGKLSTGDIPLFTVGMPGLDFGSVFKIGPTFNIYAEADASIEANLEMDVDLVYTISGGRLVYPPSQGPSGGSFSSGNSNVKLSASPNVTANAQVAAHLKPRFEFGASIVGQTADIYLEIDTYAELDLSLTGAANGSVSSNSTDSTGASTGAGGCVDILAGLGVNAGADADLLGIFKTSDTVPLFNKSFDLFKKCFGDNFQKRGYRSVGSGHRHVPLSPSEQYRYRRNHHRRIPGSQAAVGRRRIVPKSDTAFSCPSSPMNGLLPIVSEVVDGAGL